MASMQEYSCLLEALQVNDLEAIAQFEEAEKKGQQIRII